VEDNTSNLLNIAGDTVFASTAPAYNSKQEEGKAEGKSNYDSILDVFVSHSS
jgi:hypothetical protein